MSYGTARLKLDLDTKQKHDIWQLYGQQRQAYNRGVALCVDAVLANRKIPSKFDLYKQLTKDRKSGTLTPDASMMLQRAGLAEGRETAVKWSLARYRLNNDVVYWIVRLTAAEAEQAGDTDRADILRKAVKVGVRQDSLDKELKHCEAKLDRATQKRDRHEAKGTKRLFRSRKGIERSMGNVPAVVFSGQTTLSAGQVRLPKGTVLDLLDKEVILPGRDRPVWDLTKSDGLPDNYSWTGAVQVADTTRKITGRTEHRHRRWTLHAQLKREGPVPVNPSSIQYDEVLGCDPGCVVNMAVSDGRMLKFPKEEHITDRIKNLQRRRSRLTNGSRKHKRISCGIKKLHRKRANRRADAAAQIVAEIVNTPGIKAVGVESTTSNMTASAKGTANHPGKGVSAKRALNRNLYDSWFKGIRRELERACYIRGKHYVKVPAPYTSSMCHICGEPVARESQSSYWCSSCRIVGHADSNAAGNIHMLTWLSLLTGDTVSMAGRNFPSQEEWPGWQPGGRGHRFNISLAAARKGSSRTKPASPQSGEQGYDSLSN